MSNGDASFGINLRNLRQSRGYSQDKFARMIGSNQVNVSAWELGTRVPTLKTMSHVAKVFHVPLSSLISISCTGVDEDYICEVAEVLKSNSKVRVLFDQVKYLSQVDLDAVIAVVGAITKQYI